MLLKFVFYIDYADVELLPLHFTAYTEDDQSVYVSVSKRT